MILEPLLTQEETHPEPEHRPPAGQLTQILSREVNRIDSGTIHLAEYAVRRLPRGAAAKTQPPQAHTRRYGRPRRALICATAMLCALAAGYALHTAGQQPPVAQVLDATATAPCSVTFAIIPTMERQYDAVLTVTNTTGEPVPQWVVAFNEPDGLSISDSRAGVAVDNPRQTAVDSPVVHVSQQGQTVTITSTSNLDAGASLTQTSKAQYASQPGGIPKAFTLNGKRCDTTVLLGAAAVPQTTATAAVPPVVEASPRD